LPDCAVWTGRTIEEFRAKASGVGILSYSANDDIRSLKSLILYGLKGIAAYAEHAAVLGYYDDEITAFMIKALASVPKELSADELTAMVIKTGETAVKTMALLDRANTETYGKPEITKVFKVSEGWSFVRFDDMMV